MYHCFTDIISSDLVVITGPDVNHIKNVLRMKTGDDIYVSDGAGRNLICSIASISDTEITADVMCEKEDSELPVEIVLYQALPKGDKMETIIQKCTELGVARIVPVESSRCIVKLDSKGKQKKAERWQKIAQSAAEQSQRSRVPVISDVMSYKQAILDAAGQENADICRENAEGTPEMAVSGATKASENIFTYEKATDPDSLKHFLKACRGVGGVNVSRINIFVGPEGGWTEEEAEAAKSAGITWITLGKRILRTETAGMALIAAAMLNIESEN